MRAIGCLLSVIGIALFITAVVLFTAVAARSLQSNTVASVSMTPGEAAATEVLTVRTDKHCQVCVQVALRTQSVEYRGGGSGSTYRLQYAFPLEITVTDTEGRPIHAEKTEIASGHGVRVNMRESRSSSGGSARFIACFGKFEPPENGTLTATATIRPDTKYNATLDSAELIVYDNVSLHGGTILQAVLMLVAGIPATVLGVLMFLMGGRKKT